MRSRDVVGKRIARVDHQRIPTGRGKAVVVVLRIVLDDGTKLAPHAFETENEPEATILVTELGVSHSVEAIQEERDAAWAAVQEELDAAHAAHALSRALGLGGAS